MDILKQRKEHEELAIKLRGFAIRAFQEDNNVTGSWAYTVGLKTPVEGEVIIYTRAGIEAHILEDLLNDFGRKAIKNGIHQRTVTEADNYTNTITNQPMKVRLVPMRVEAFHAMLVKFGTPVEGNSNQANHYWLTLSDAGGLFPHQNGYVDFFQTGLPADTVGNSPEKSEE